MEDKIEQVAREIADKVLPAGGTCGNGNLRGMEQAVEFMCENIRNRALQLLRERHAETKKQENRR